MDGQFSLRILFALFIIWKICQLFTLTKWVKQLAVCLLLELKKKKSPELKRGKFSTIALWHYVNQPPWTSFFLIHVITIMISSSSFFPGWEFMYFSSCWSSQDRYCFFTSYSLSLIFFGPSSDIYVSLKYFGREVDIILSKNRWKKWLFYRETQLPQQYF